MLRKGIRRPRNPRQSVLPLPNPLLTPEKFLSLTVFVFAYRR